jgi:hypothetical protein
MKVVVNGEGKGFTLKLEETRTEKRSTVPVAK